MLCLVNQVKLATWIESLRLSLWRVSYTTSLTKMIPCVLRMILTMLLVVSPNLKPVNDLTLAIAFRTQYHTAMLINSPWSRLRMNNLSSLSIIVSRDMDSCRSKISKSIRNSIREYIRSWGKRWRPVYKDNELHLKSQSWTSMRPIWRTLPNLTCSCADISLKESSVAAKSRK